MQLLGHMLTPGHGVEQLEAGVLGLGGHEADEIVAGNFVQCGQQVGKVVAGAKVFAVGVDVLAQQGDLLISLGSQLAHLADDLLRVAAALTAPDIGHDAVGAEVVAAVHDADPRAGAALTDHRHTLGNGAVLVLHGEHPATAGIDLPEKFRELPQGLRAEHQIHMAVGLAHLFRHLGPLGHTAAQADDLLRIGFLGVGQGAQIAVDPLFRVVADGAGVQHDDVRLGRLGDEFAAHGLQHAHDVLAVGHVLLAAEGVHQRMDGLAPLGVQLFYFSGKFPLALHVRVRQDNILSFQGYLLHPARRAGRYLIMVLYHIQNRNTRNAQNKSCKFRRHAL